MRHGSFATAISCIDGRTQVLVIDYMKTKYNVHYVDIITEPGPARILAENEDKVLIDSIRRRLEISTLKHGSKPVAIVAPHDCAGNTMNEET